MSLVQIVKVEGEINRVPKDQVPIIELDLSEDRRVINIERFEVRGPAGKYSTRYEDRLTYDWDYTLYVEWRMQPVKRRVPLSEVRAP